MWQLCCFFTDLARCFLSATSLMIGGARWFIRSLVSFGRRGGSSRI